MRTAKLCLEFAPGARRVSWSGRALLLAGLVLLGYGVVQLGDLWAAKTRASSDLNAIETRRSTEAEGRNRTTKADPRQAANSRAAHQVADSLMTPWADLLSSLGSVRSDAVALLSVEPSVAKRSVRLTAEARDLHEMLVYVGALQRDSRLASVVLVAHQIQAQAPGTPVRFQIQAEWRDVR